MIGLNGPRQYPPLVVEAKGYRQRFGLASNTIEGNWVELDLIKMNHFMLPLYSFIERLLIESSALTNTNLIN